jgi:hypothetical protein
MWQRKRTTPIGAASIRVGSIHTTRQCLQCRLLLIRRRHEICQPCPTPAIITKQNHGQHLHGLRPRSYFFDDEIR